MDGKLTEELAVDERPPADADEPEIDPRYMVPGLSRGLALLQRFTRDHPAQTLAELADGMGLSRSAAYRLLYTLEKEDFVQRDRATRRYRPTTRILTLGFEFLNSQAINDIAQPFLRRLSDITGAAAHLVVLDGWQVVYLARVAPPVALVSNLQVGTRLPAHLATTGRLLLSGLDDDRLRQTYRQIRRKNRGAPPPPLETLEAELATHRRHGYIYSGSLIDPGLKTFASLVRDSSGAVAAAINVVGPGKLLDDFGGEVALRGVVGDAALSISRQLGYVGGVPR